MDAIKAAKMAAVLETIQQRWGTHTLQTARQSLSHAPSTSGIPTGFPALDALLLSGIPRGQTTELVGSPTSGVLTLALRIMAAAQTVKPTTAKTAIYFDLEETFDPDYAVGCGIQLEHLILVRPDTPLEALDITRELLLSGQVAVLTLDAGREALEASLLRRFTQVLASSGCVVLLLMWLQDRPQSSIYSSPAALRLQVERQDWLRREAQLVGYRSTVTVLKGQGTQGQQAEIDIWVEGIRREIK